MTRATALGLGSLLLWALLALLGSAVRRLPPFETLTITFAAGAAVGVVVARVRRAPLAALFRQPPAAWAIGLLGFFGYHACYFYALATAPPAHVTLVCYLWPLLLVLGSGRPRLAQLAGALLALGGAWTAIAGDGLRALDPGSLSGLGAALACAVIWAGYSVAQRRFAAVPVEALAGTCLVTAGLGAGVHLALEPTVAPTAGEWVALLALGLGPVGAAFFAWDHAMKRGDTHVLGVLANGVPVVSTALLVAAGVAVPTLALVAACVLVVGGVVVARLAPG